MENYYNIAFDNRTTSVRELLRQVQAERIKKANPKMKVNVDVTGTAAPPLVNFEFVDGTNVSYVLLPAACCCLFLSLVCKHKLKMMETPIDFFFQISSLISYYDVCISVYLLYYLINRKTSKVKNSLQMTC